MSEIFRKKSLERINNPDELDQYMRVTNPPVLFALATVVLLLIGMLVWGATAKIETKADAVVICKEDEVVCYISQEYVSDIKVGMQVTVGEKTLRITTIGMDAIPVSTLSLSEYQKELGGLEEGDYVYLAELDGDLVDGNYEGTVILEKISPISFLLNAD